MKILKGKPVAERMDREVSGFVADIDTPHLSAYLIGGDRSSEIYAGSKVKKGKQLGISVDLKRYGSESKGDDILEDIMADSADPEVNGIMIERPLPGDLDIHALMTEVAPIKDVEGIHPENYGLLGMGRGRFIPPTPLGALMLMKHYGVNSEGSEVVVVGRSPNVGRPLATLLSQKAEWGNSTVTLVHSRTRDISNHTRRADIVLTAAGRPKMIKGNMIKQGAVLIDLGINPENGGIVGDVDMDDVSDRAAMVTPTPGGTGPVTVSCMFLNLVLAWKLQNGDNTPFSDNLVRMIYDIDG